MESIKTTSKWQQIRLLAEKRRQDTMRGMTKPYKKIEDFHGGIFDNHDFVSPWALSAHNVNADVMVVGQDWNSEEWAKQPPKDPSLGYGADVPTNVNLHLLLNDVFGLRFSDVYATNLFVFVKPGRASAHIPRKDMIYSANEYTINEIRIIKPKIILCLGLKTYSALCRVTKNVVPSLWRGSSVEFESSRIYGLPHTGSYGMMNCGGRESAKAIWTGVAKDAQFLLS